MRAALKWALLSSCLIALLFLSSSCGYRFGDGEENSERISLSIPYFSGDQGGQLTEAVIRACAHSSSFCYVSNEGRWQLCGQVCDDEVEEIGYAYDRETTFDPSLQGFKRRNLLIPVEGRRYLKVEVSLVDLALNKTIYGPFIVRAGSDFDFINPDDNLDVSSSQGETILFSLGQLDSRFGAEAAVATSVYKIAAEKIFWGLDHLPFVDQELRGETKEDVSLPLKK